MRESAGKVGATRSQGEEIEDDFFVSKYQEHQLSIHNVFVLGISWWAELSWEEVMGYVSHLESVVSMLTGAETTPELSISIAYWGGYNNERCRLDVRNGAISCCLCLGGCVYTTVRWTICLRICGSSDIKVRYYNF